MFRNYLTVAVRNLLRNKSTSFIKILSLAVGMVSFAIIALYVFHELSFDKFHNQPEHVYRIVKDFVNDDGSRIPDATTPPAMAPAVQRDLPEIAYATRVFPSWGGKYLLQQGDDKRIEEKLVRIDSSFFDVFTFPFKIGDKNTSLQGSDFIILTESVAKRYFGDANPIGKTIRVDLGTGRDFSVTGVLYDVPETSHFTFDFLISVRSFQYNDLDTDWGWYNFYTYVRLKEGTNREDFEQKLQPLFKRYQPEEEAQYYSQALTDIHLRSNLKWELGNNGDQASLYVLATVAILIILLAAINYVNLVIAQSAKRAKEVGIRKAAGGNKSLLVRQFLFESELNAVIALVVSLAVAEMLLPFLRNILSVELSFFSKESRPVLYLLTGIALFTGFVAGLYPAFYLAAFQPAKVLKGIVNTSGTGFVRKGLVTFQFVISTVLICGTLVISSQLNFIRSTNLGFETENIIVVPGIRNVNSGDKTAAMATEFQKIAGVVNAGAADGILGGQNWTNGVRAKDSENGVLLNFLSLDHAFLNTMNIQLKEGRNFSHQFTSDSSAIVLNEAAVKQLGIKEPVIGSQIIWGEGDDGTVTFAEVVGVVKDFHFTSFHEPIKPFGFVLNEGRANNLFVKVSSENLKGTIAELKSAWERIEHERPFEFFFQDERVARLYEADARFQTLFAWFTLVAIIIASLGLLGLSAFMAQQRVKEIGIRKVLGASIPELVRLLSSDFLKLVAIAITFSIPIALFSTNQWLQSFAYRVDVSWTVYAISAGIALGITLFTVSSQAIGAAMRNPVDSLRSE